MAAMTVKYDGDDYSFDLNEITVQQARTLKSIYGITLGNLGELMTESDPDALTAVYWLMMVQNNVSCAVDQIDFKIVEFADALDKGYEEAEKREKAQRKNTGGRPKAAAK